MRTSTLERAPSPKYTARSFCGAKPPWAIDLAYAEEVRRVADEAGLVEAQFGPDAVAVRIAGSAVVDVAARANRHVPADRALVRIEVVLRGRVLVPHRDVQVPVAVDVTPGDRVRSAEPELRLRGGRFRR
jgi:hypothetical protein